jgi:hypothetical protein
MSLEILANLVTTAPDRRSAQPPFVRTPPSMAHDDLAPEDDAKTSNPPPPRPGTALEGDWK